MKNSVIKIISIIAVFAGGFYIPDLFQPDNNVQVADSEQGNTRLDCKLINNQCMAGDYKIELLDGSFEAMAETTFRLTRGDKAIDTEVLITSDDQLFGTITSQQIEETPKQRHVLIPYCGNPLMHIIIVDSQAKKEIVINKQTK